MGQLLFVSLVMQMTARPVVTYAEKLSPPSVAAHLTRPTAWSGLNEVKD